MSKPTGHHFSAQVVRSSDGRHALHAQGRPDVVVGPPPEFGGHGDVWSPEHLLVASVTACFVATFEFVAGRQGLHIGELTCTGKGHVEKSEQGLAFSSVDLHARLRVPHGETTRAVALLDRAKRLCLVSNSLKARVDLAFDVVEIDTSKAA